MRSVIIGPSLCLCTFSLVANTLFSHRLQSQPCIKLWIALSVLRGTGCGETQTNEPCITLFLIAFFGLDIADNFWDNPSFIGLQFAHLLACLPHSMLLVWLVCPWDRPSKLLFFLLPLPTSYFLLLLLLLLLLLCCSHLCFSNVAGLSRAWDQPLSTGFPVL